MDPAKKSEAHGREEKIRAWFNMRLIADCSGLEGLFAGDAVYIESWGPEYHGRDAIAHWFA